MKVLETTPKIAQIQSRLTKYSYLSRSNLPGSADAKIFQILQNLKSYPDRKVHPNFYHWYILLKQFSQNSIARWINEELYLDSDDTLITQVIKIYKSPENDLLPLEPKQSKNESIHEIEYIIDITLKTSADNVAQKLQRELEQYKVQILEAKDNKVLIMSKIYQSKCQGLLDKISKCIEYQNLQVKKQKKFKTISSLNGIGNQSKNDQKAPAEK